jgi:hypothetical protein
VGSTSQSNAFHSRASAASQTLESRRTNTWQPQNFVFAHLRSILHQGIGVSPQIFKALLLQASAELFLAPAKGVLSIPGTASVEHLSENGAGLQLPHETIEEFNAIAG